MPPTQAAVIGGALREGVETFEVRNPHDSSLVANVGLGVATEIAAARAAQPPWVAPPGDELPLPAGAHDRQAAGDESLAAGVVVAITPHDVPTDVSSIAPAHIVAAGSAMIWEPSDHAVVNGAMNGCFSCSGRVCTRAGRLQVHEDVHDASPEDFRARAAALRIGDPLEEATEMGPVRDPGTLARVRRHVEDARAEGVSIEQFGAADGLYHPATILTDVTLDMQIMREETFGPVAPIHRIGPAEQAAGIAHMSGSGLIASLRTRDPATAWRVGEALAHGSVDVNEASNYTDQLAPFCGALQAGVGPEPSL